MMTPHSDVEADGSLPLAASSTTVDDVLLFGKTEASKMKRIRTFKKKLSIEQIEKIKAIPPLTTDQADGQWLLPHNLFCKVFETQDALFLPDEFLKHDNIISYHLPVSDPKTRATTNNKDITAETIHQFRIDWAKAISTLRNDAEDAFKAQACHRAKLMGHTNPHSACVTWNDIVEHMKSKEMKHQFETMPSAYFEFTAAVCHNLICGDSADTAWQMQVATTWLAKFRCSTSSLYNAKTKAPIKTHWVHTVIKSVLQLFRKQVSRCEMTATGWEFRRRDRKKQKSSDDNDPKYDIVEIELSNSAKGKRDLVKIKNEKKETNLEDGLQ